MTADRLLADVVDIADLSRERAVRLAADMREHAARDRATAQALRDYLDARGARADRSP